MALNLEQLPTDVLDLICTEICLGHEFQMRRDLIHDLQALCMTSKAICAAVQPFLYRCIKTSRYFPLIRTLHRRPDLARSVRSFEMDGSNRSWTSANDEELELLAQIAQQMDGDYKRSWTWTNGEEFEFLAQVAHHVHMSDPLDPNFGSVSHDGASRERFCIEILIALLPNLALLNFNIDNDVQHQHANFPYLLRRSEKLGKANLANLRRLTFEAPFADSYWMSRPEIGALLKAAPNLDELVFAQTRGLEGPVPGEDALASIFPPLPRVRSLRFENPSLEDNSESRALLRHILQSCPKLDRFGFNMFNRGRRNHNLEPPRVLDLLIPHRKTLKMLDLYCANSNGLGGNLCIDGGILQRFTSLEMLKIGDKSFCQHDHENVSTVAFTCLTDILPGSMKHLEIHCAEPFSGMQDFHAVKDIKEVGVQAYTGRFPNLEHVKVYGTAIRRVRPETDELHEDDELCENADIQELQAAFRRLKNSPNRGPIRLTVFNKGMWW